MALSLHNTALLLNLSQDGYPAPYEIFSPAGGPTTQAAGLLLIGPCIRILSGPANLALVLPDIWLGSPCPLTYVVNDGPAASVVFPALNPNTGNAAQQLNGVNNGSLSIPAGEAAVFSLLQPSKHARGGGEQQASFVNGWAGAVLP